jgi:GT2 family glycosyltransferase
VSATDKAGPAEDTPDISVVMVSHGAWKCTERAVQALQAHAGVPFELIIVDNASDPATRGHLSRLPKAHVLLNDHNEGFGPASNRGAEHARADLLVFLNTDAYVTRGWLEPLREMLDDSSVAAVVPQYLNPDGSLQEAGSLLAQDGSVHVYGDGDDAGHPSYRFRRIVDYGGAACLIVRRDVFQALGGFDRAYAPAYYEDADLGLRIARRGMSVVYQPRSRVVHARYGSGSRDAAMRLSERNRSVFRTRWASDLRGRPWTFRRKMRQAVVVARDAMATPRLLVLAHQDEPNLFGLLGDLLRGWPRSRMTWATETPAADPVSERWLDNGVEVLPGYEWLEDRLFHYDMVLTGADIGAELSAAAGRTQPHAPHLRLADLDLGADPLGRVVPSFAAAGIAPPTLGS